MDTFPDLLSMTANTSRQYESAIDKARKIFIDKMKDYGTAWRILRVSSITDQIFIKARRIRSIEEKGVQKVNEGIDNEFFGIINYCIIALIQLAGKDDTNMADDKIIKLYDFHADESKRLMEIKNHDYGEAWRNMRTSSMTDLILMKILRIKQIEDNDGKTIISEGIDANYYDIINYSVFALIKLSDKN
jgi:hypothetical protein